LKTHVNALVAPWIPAFAGTNEKGLLAKRNQEHLRYQRPVRPAHPLRPRGGLRQAVP